MRKTYDQRGHPSQRIEKMPQGEKKVIFANNNEGTIIRKDSVGNLEISFLEDVYLVVDIKLNLITISQLCDIGCIVKFEKHQCSISNFERKIIAKGDRKQNAYNMAFNQVTSTHEHCMIMVSNEKDL